VRHDLERSSTMFDYLVAVQFQVRIEARAERLSHILPRWKISRCPPGYNFLVWGTIVPLGGVFPPSFSPSEAARVRWICHCPFWADDSKQPIHEIDFGQHSLHHS